MNVWANYVASWRQIFNYHGKTRRRDFWAAIIGMLVASIVVSTILSGAMVLGDPIALPAHWLENFFFLAQFLQYLSMSVRRLHSLRLSGNYQWLMLLPGVHMIVLHALPEAEKDARAPWYHMINADNEPIELAVDHKGHVNGILSNAFGYMWRNFFNFKDTVSRGNFLWARVAWSLFSCVIGTILFAVIIGVVMVRMVMQTVSNFGGLRSMTPSAPTPELAGSLLAGISTFAFVLGIIATFIIVLPLVSLTARRLHDQALSAGWVFLYLAGSIGRIVLLLLTLLPAKEGQTRYPGADGLTTEAHQDSAGAPVKASIANSAVSVSGTSTTSSEAPTKVFYPSAAASNVASTEVFYPQSASSQTPTSSEQVSADRDKDE